MARPKNAVKGRAVTTPRKKKAAEPKPVTHTPGPWLPVIVAKDSDSSGWLIETERDARIVASIPVAYRHVIGGAEAAANAHLIAAAPDMHAALKRIRDARDYCAEHGTYPEDVRAECAGARCFDDWAADVAEAAIAKAKGGGA